MSNLSTSIGRVRRVLYRSASRLGDAQAISTGSPKKIVKRAVRKPIYRLSFKLIRKALRSVGL